VWRDLDLLDVFSVGDALEGITDVYHCAGMVSFKKADRNQLFRVNEQGTANMVNACLANKRTRLCHVSTVATINNSDARKNVTEELFWKQKDQKVYTDKFVTIRQEGDVLYGQGLTANEDLSDYVITHPSGDMEIEE
jgi:nucleoside-diphosphate-sugar epimerase